MNSIILKTWTGSGSLSLDGHTLHLDYNGKNTVIPLSQVISFEIKEPKGKMRPGMITIRLGGASDTRIHLTSMLSIGGSNNIEFPHAYEYAQAAHEMQKAIEAYSSHPVAQGSVDIDDLRKYKALLDDGVISQEDFDAKKKQFLGL